MSRRTTVVALVVALVGVVAIGVLTASSGSPESEAGSTAASSSLDVPFEYLDGSQGNLSEFSGTPVVVNFWASWCPACVAEMPDFEEVHARLEGDVVFLGLNMQETDREAAGRLVEETGVSYQLGRDPDGSIFNEFGGVAMPTTVFIGADGTVVDTHAGALFAEDLEQRIRDELLTG